MSCGGKDVETTTSTPTPAASAAPPPLTPGATVNLTLSQTAPQYTFDSLGPINYPELQKSNQVSGDTNIIVSGWALDKAANTTAGGVDVVLDQTPYRARYGISRGDVADHFKRPDYINCGFQLILAKGQMAKGQHTIAIRVISSDRKSYGQGPLVKFTVN